MHELQAFIYECRHQQLSDEQIRQLLLANGWSEGQIQAALLGVTIAVPAAPLTVPLPSMALAPAAAQLVTDADERPSLSALEAALHHVLLWVFILSADITLGFVSALIYGKQSSTTAITAYITIMLATFIPYVAFYMYYLRKQRKQPALITSKVWSILTIVFQSIGLIGAIITIIIALLTIHSGNSALVITAAGAIAIIDALVITAYAFASFVSIRTPKRTLVLRIYPLVLFVVLAVFGIVGLAKQGPLHADAMTRQHLVSTVQSIREYTKKQGQLPESLNQIPTDTNGISYTVVKPDEYRLCATFHVSTYEPGYNDANSSPIEDNYVNTDVFDYTPSGNQCFTIQAEHVASTATSSSSTTYDNSGLLPESQ